MADASRRPCRARGEAIADLPVLDDMPCPSTVTAEEEMVVLYLNKLEVFAEG